MNSTILPESAFVVSLSAASVGGLVEKVENPRVATTVRRNQLKTSRRGAADSDVVVGIVLVMIRAEVMDGMLLGAKALTLLLARNRHQNIRPSLVFIFAGTLF